MMDQQQLDNITEANLLRSEIQRDFTTSVESLFKNHGVVYSDTNIDSTVGYTFYIDVFKAPVSETIKEASEKYLKEVGRYIHFVPSLTVWENETTLRMQAYRSRKPRFAVV